MTFLYLNSEHMGQGEPQLGRKLMALFLDKLASSDVKVDAVGCVNSGIHLTLDDSPVLESLRRLEARGAQIITCGTCLEHHGCRDRLAIGGVGDMVGTVQVLSTADRVIRV